MSAEHGPLRPGDHLVFDELAVGWALHALNQEDEATFAGHLFGCERCARTVTEASSVMKAMAIKSLSDGRGGDRVERLRSDEVD